MSKAKLIPDDFARAAAALGCDVAAIQAVTEVEAAGDGFLPDDRPKILFERHVMYRELTKEAGIGEAVHFSLAYPDVVNRTPGGYVGGAGEWDRLATAVTINRSCALASASWGMFQIMGYHWQTLRYPTIQAFVNAMYADAASQLDAFVRFIRADTRLQRALQMHDWLTFARIYNGPNFSKNSYDKRLQTAYTKALNTDAMT